MGKNSDGISSFSDGL